LLYLLLMLKRPFTFLLLLAIIPSLALNAESGPTEDEKSSPHEVVVIGKRIEKNEARKNKSSFIREIYLEEYESRSKDLAEILEEVPGIHIKRYGGTGSYSTISLRGSSAGQVTVLLDGVPLNAAQTGMVNLGDIPLSNIEKIEIYQSNVPVEFNTSPIGGVVNLVTKKSSSKRFYLKSTAGSFNTYGVHVQGYYDNEFSDILGLGSTNASRGNFKFLDDNGTEFNEEDDEITERKNNQFQDYNLFLKIGLDITKKIKFQVSNGFFRKLQGLPGIGSTQTENSELRTTKDMLNLRLDWSEFLTPSVDFSAVSFYSFDKRYFYDLDGEFGFGRSRTSDKRDFYGQNFLFNIYPVERMEVSLSTGIKKERFKPWEEFSKPNRYGVQNRSEKYASSSVEFHFFDHRLILQGAVRYHHYKSLFDGDDGDFTLSRSGKRETIKEEFFSPSQGIIIKPFDFLSLKGNIGRYHRVPNFVELFGIKGLIIGNKELVPEKSNNWDAGFFVDLNDFYFFDFLNFEYSYFENNVEDIIQFQMVSSTESKAFNTENAMIRGHELSLDFFLLQHFKFYGHYTYLNAVNKTQQGDLEGNKLPFRPEEEARGRITLFFKNLEVFLEAEFMREVFLNPANNDKVPQRTTYNSGLSLKPFDFLQLTFEVKNFTDNSVFDMRKYPLPGISWYLSFILRYP